MICLGGGPSHLDTYDMRPEAPVEYRGEFRPVSSRVAGMPMCELLPRQAEIADRLSVVRSMQWSEPCHQFFEMCTGFPEKAARPSVGALVNRLYLPRFEDLAGDGDKVRAEQPRYHVVSGPLLLWCDAPRMLQAWPCSLHSAFSSLLSSTG